MVSFDDIPQKSLHIRIRKIAGKSIIIDRSSAYELSESGLAIIECIDGIKNVKNIIEQLSKLYIVDIKELESDVIDFLNTMIDNKFVSVKNK